MTLAIGMVLVTTALMWALRREFKRLDQQRRMRAFLRTNPQALHLRRNMVEFTIQLRDDFTPAMQKVARAMADAAPALQRLGDAAREAELRAANAYRKGGKP